MAAVVKLHDASRIGGKKNPHPSRRLRPRGVEKNLLAESIGFSVPKLDSDAVAGITSLTTKVPLSPLKPKETDAENVLPMYRIMQTVLGQDEEEVQEEVDLQPQPQEKKAEPVPAAVVKTEVKQNQLMQDVDELRSLLITEPLVTMPVSDRRSNVDERVEQVHIPESYYNWLDANTPMTTKSGRPAGYLDWIDVEGVEFDTIEVETAVYDYIGDLRLDHTRRVLPVMHLVPKVWNPAQLEMKARYRLLRSLLSKGGSKATIHMGPPLPANDTVPWDDSPTAPPPAVTVQTEEVIVPFYKGRVKGYLPYMKSVEAQRYMMEISKRAEFWVKTERAKRVRAERNELVSIGHVFSDFIPKHIHVDNVLAKTAVLPQRNEVVEPKKDNVVSITEAKSYVKQGEPCDLVTAKQRRHVWKERGAPLYHRYRSPSGKQIYQDGLDKVNALDHAQQTEFYLASKKCMNQWRMEKQKLLQYERYLLTMRTKGNTEPRGADAVLTEQWRYENYWLNVSGISSLLVMEVKRPSLTRNYMAKNVIHSELASQTRSRILKELILAEADFVLERRKQIQADKLHKKMVKKRKTDPYLLGISATRKEDKVANGKVEQVAITIKPAPMQDQVIADRNLFDKVMADERIRHQDSSIITDIRSIVQQTKQLPEYFGRMFKTTDSGIAVPV